LDPQISFVLASIASGLASVCVVLSLWSFIRLSSVEAKLKDLDTKLPPKRIQELEQAFDALTDAFDGLQQKNAEWKGSVHNSVQRLDQVMRKNEKAAAALLDEDGNLTEDVVKAEMPDMAAVIAPDPVTLSKQAALRFRYNKNRGI